MSLMQNRWFRRLGLGTIAALSLGAAVMTTAPAQAHDYGYNYGYGYRGPAMNHRVAYFPRFFYGFGGGQHWHHYDHWGNRWH
jgi:hypothetical protein